MSQYEGLGDPDYDELVPHRPIVVGSTMFNPERCVESHDRGIEHSCVHDWRCYWGNQAREI